MPQEIERKFRVNGDSWNHGVAGIPIVQGYLALGPPVAVRVRIKGSRGILNVKTSTLSISRMEYEYEIPLEDARELIERSCVGRPIEKTRYVVPFEGMDWEVDVFEGMNKGLVVAEIELVSEDQIFARPAWLGAEVSGEARFLNSHLCLRPYTAWTESER